MEKKLYIIPATETHEVQAKHLMGTEGISGTGSGQSTDPPHPAPKIDVF